jgi:hypothetical protein
MRFLVDECVGPFVVRWLCENNHDAASAYEDCRGWKDESILDLAQGGGPNVEKLDEALAAGREESAIRRNELNQDTGAL